MKTILKTNLEQGAHSLSVSTTNLTKQFALLKYRLIIAIGAWIFFYKLVPETKGKSLEQIEEHWRSGKTPREL